MTKTRTRFLNKLENMAEALYRAGDSISQESWEYQKNYLWGYSNAGKTIELVSAEEIQEVTIGPISRFTERPEPIELNVPNHWAMVPRCLNGTLMMSRPLNEDDTCQLLNTALPGNPSVLSVRGGIAYRIYKRWCARRRHSPAPIETSSYL